MPRPPITKTIMRIAAVANIVLDMERGHYVTLGHIKQTLNLSGKNACKVFTDLDRIVPVKAQEITEDHVDIFRLTRTEAKVLAMFAARPNRPINSDELYPALGHTMPTPVRPIIRQHVVNLRRKEVPIYTWNGRGYALNWVEFQDVYEELCRDEAKRYRPRVLDARPAL